MKTIAKKLFKVLTSKKLWNKIGMVILTTIALWGLILYIIAGLLWDMSTKEHGA